MDPDLQVYILSTLYGSKISQNSLCHILSHLEVNHHDSEIVGQLRRKLKGYIIAVCKIAHILITKHHPQPSNL
jgi:hypothetical protein